MTRTLPPTLSYDGPVEVAEGVYWVGPAGEPKDLHCNPYLVVDGGEALVIDAGSRADFPSVMIKILQSRVAPSSIKAFVFHHYDPDICGSISNFEDVIGTEGSTIISDEGNHLFIKHYSISSTLLSLEDVNFRFTFSSGRTVEFIKIPYAHTEGSFVSFDSKTGVLFTSDLFGGYSSIGWELFLDLQPACVECENPAKCPVGKPYCPLQELFRYHRKIIPSEKALEYALQQIMDIPFYVIAPQHGSVIREPEDILLVFERLLSLKGVGIDGVVDEAKTRLPVSILPLKERFEKHGN